MPAVSACAGDSGLGDGDDVSALSAEIAHLNRRSESARRLELFPIGAPLPVSSRTSVLGTSSCFRVQGEPDDPCARSENHS
eukprot:9895237-Alexandrium_andersonii.AAC.1